MKTTILPTFGILLGCLSFLLAGGCSAETKTTPPSPQEDDNGSSTADNYPLEVCVVSGKDLDSMGGPHVHEHNGTIVKFCCEPCLDDFNEDPDKYLAKLKQ
tara:strand:- start:304 stop:606 length:303 start_codon:yes stop_codon:yes gene_type:complete